MDFSSGSEGDRVRFSYPGFRRRLGAARPSDVLPAEPAPDPGRGPWPDRCALRECGAVVARLGSVAGIRLREGFGLLSDPFSFLDQDGDLRRHRPSVDLSDGSFHPAPDFDARGLAREPARGAGTGSRVGGRSGPSLSSSSFRGDVAGARSPLLICKLPDEGEQ